MTNHIDSWHIEATRADGNIITVYGLRSESAAQAIGAEFWALKTVLEVTLIHTTKATPRARWGRAAFSLKRP